MPTTSNGDCCVELMQGTLVRPIARYPSSVAYDDPLKVASNRVRTSLVRSVGSGDTLLTVSDASRIVPQMLLTVDNEVVSVSAVTDNILTVIRGFDGTQPCSHSAGSVLNANIVAWHHNALAAEITAIEQALGPNLSNINTDGSGIISSDFVWNQTPGGSLIPGLNVVTLSPVPKGVNGSNLYHYVYVSGGTGAAEACLISGGTAVAGAASGTVFITCANAHSGAWTIQTATSGIQEAIYSTPTDGGIVKLPAGRLPLYKGFAITKSSVTVVGQGIGATTIDVSGMGSGYACWMRNVGSCWLRGVIIRGHGSAMSATDYAIVIENSLSVGVDNVDVAEVPNGVKVTGGSTYRVWLQYMSISYLTGTGATGILIEDGGDHFLSYIAYSDADSNDLASIRVRQSGGMILQSSDCLGCGMLIDPDGTAMSVRWLFLRGAMFDSTKGPALRMAPVNGGSIVGVVISNSWFASSSTADGVSLEATTPNKVEMISFTGCRAVNNNRHGMQFVGTGVRSITVSASLIIQNNTGGAGAGIFVENAKNVIISSNQIGNITGSPTQHAAGISFGAGAADSIVVSDNIITDFIGGPIVGMEYMTGLNRYFSNNLPTSSLEVTAAAAATFNLTGIPYEMYHVTGTTPITTLSPFWYGRKIRLVFMDAAPGGVATGGNIKKTRSVAQYEMLMLEYDSNGWNVLGP